ncbi:MAG: DUF348 domain-containing protein [Clostridia bacterium]|nr:DUF348 domain-containing protein [Clostridia bacterium]
MITNSLSVDSGKRSKAFRILTVVVAILFVCSVTITAFAATGNPEVTVVDGEKSVSITAKSGSPREIVKEAGLILSPNDSLDTSAFNAEEGGTIVINRSSVIRIEDNGLVSYFVGYSDTVDDILAGKGIVIGEKDEVSVDTESDVFEGMKVFIKRAFTVNVEVDGETRKAYLAEGTVAEALVKAGVEIGDDDIVEPSLDTELKGFTEIKVTRVEYKTVIEEETLEYETEIIKSDDIYVDETEIVTPGVNGEKQVYYTEKYVDGELVETVMTEEVVTKNPVNEIKKVGTKSRETLAAYKNTNAPISELKLPSDVKLDENGIPVNYTKKVSAKATAYTGDPATSTGRKPMPGHIAVDPSEYPYGSELYIVSADGSYVYGYCIAADTGGFVEMGNTDVDLYMDNEDMCYDWGNRNITIYVLN